MSVPLKQAPVHALTNPPVAQIGDMLYFHLWKRADFVLDVARDVRRINDLSVKAKRSGMIILGGGLPKHHTCNANLMRNGADYAVFINTGACPLMPCSTFVTTR